MLTHSLFKKPDEPKKKQLKEEKMLIKLLREEYREEMIKALTDEGDDKNPPSETEINEALDIFIENLRNRGELDSLLSEYLQVKIEKAKP